MAKASQVVIMEGEYYIIKSPNGKVLEAVSYTHLDVYKRQAECRDLYEVLEGLQKGRF